MRVLRTDVQENKMERPMQKDMKSAVLGVGKETDRRTSSTLDARAKEEDYD